MIISASRRTDIPAFYAQWFINRVRAGYCTVPNPFNAVQVRRVSLDPEDVEVIVFWTRNPRPLFPYLDELDRRGYRYYFLYTLLGNPRLLDPHSPDRKAAIRTFQELSSRLGPQRVVWRYDPIVLSRITPPDYHRRAYGTIARALQGYTQRSVISLLDVYAKIRKRMQEASLQGAQLWPYDGSEAWFASLMSDLVGLATANDMRIFSCAQELDLVEHGIRPGKCIDADYIQAVFDLDVTHTKDPGQREACGCVVSRDIGMYDACLFGCRYCYATSSFERARHNYAQHDPRSPSLLGWYEAEVEMDDHLRLL
jgi:hypothetical protein